MSARRPREKSTLTVDWLEARLVPTTQATAIVEPFQGTSASGLPTGWSQWTSGNGSFAVDPTGTGLGDNGRLVTDGTSATTERAWMSAAFGPDVETSAAIYLNTAVPIQILARGQSLNTTTPSYYAATVTRGLNVQLSRVVNGNEVVLGSVKSTDYVSGKWVTITLRAEGDRLKIFVYRGDTNQYLTSTGTWSRQPTAAIDRVDSSIRTGGQVGFARPAKVAGQGVIDSLRVGPVPVTPNALEEERFASGPTSSLPAGWSQWSATPVSYSILPDQTLRMDGASTGAARAWWNTIVPADAQLSSSIFVDGLVPAGVFARGQNVDATNASYYAVTVSRGLQVNLIRSVNGVISTLATVKSKDYVSGIWVQASLVVKGNELRVQIYRSDTGQYLNADGSWGLVPVFALTRADAAITASGKAGLVRGAGYSGQLVFDNFLVTSAPTTLTPGRIPTELDKPTTPPTPGPDLPPAGTSPPPVPVPPPITTPTPVTTPAPAAPSNPSLPAVPQHYSWIRLADLAYYGTPLNSTAQNLLKNSVDLVIPNVAYLGDVAKVAPTTPQLIYTNVSNIYLDLLTDWLTYADKNHFNRESAFYHVTTATPFSGLSASAVPVNQFWGVYETTSGGVVTNLTSDAKTSTEKPFVLPTPGGTLAMGYLEKYREINLSLQNTAASGYSGVWEYVSAVDSQGRPTAWTTLKTITDSTTGGKKSGQVTFDPPKDWKTASIGGSVPLYYVRFRATGTAAPPTALTVLGRDYTNFQNQSGTIPAFDTKADKDGDGYLNDAEYANRRPGFNARFAYESRLTYPNYGPQRYATNVSNSDFRAWAANYLARTAAANPLASGFFVDNSIGRLAVDPTTIAESLTYYTLDYGSLLGKINVAIGSKWLLANTAGAGISAEPIARAGVSTLEEFALRPTTANYVQLEDLAATLADRRQLSGGKAYEVLDSLPGSNPNDPRTLTTTLAMYYLLADPTLSFLMLNGGNEPNSDWSRHWTAAVTYNVGKPVGNYSVRTTGTDPANSSLTYKIYQRQYQNALVLYKPLSYNKGVNGTMADNTATAVPLGAVYRVVNADGTLGPPITSIKLRNGEGVVLAKV
ncbi:MAG TPA: hypothetical protein VGJ05_06115 [Fimbriiglobus sp.]|jgi:hypothetical protein